MAGPLKGKQQCLSTLTIGYYLVGVNPSWTFIGCAAGNWTA